MKNYNEIIKMGGDITLKHKLVKLLILGNMVLLMGCGASKPGVSEQESVVTDVQMTDVEQETFARSETQQQPVEEESEEMSSEQEGGDQMNGEEKSAYTVPEGYREKKQDVVYGTLTTVEYDSNTTGTTRKVNVILPAGYDENKEYPVLYLLHGIGGDQNEWLGADPVVVLGNMVASQEAEEMIVVMPNVRARANDGGNPSDIFTVEHFQAFDHFINDLRDDLMPYIEEHYAVKTGRENTAIAGLSMGGRESLYIGLTMADTFGYVGAFCPAPGVLPYPTEKGLFETDQFMLPQEYDSFIMIVEGSNDTVVNEWPSTYHQTLLDNGTEHVYYVTEGGHDFTVWTHGLYNFAKELFHENN